MNDYFARFAFNLRSEQEVYVRPMKCALTAAHVCCRYTFVPSFIQMNESIRK